MARLPVPGSDDGSWGDILNDFLSQELGSDGSLNIKTNGILSAKEDKSSKGQASGYAPLDSTGKLPSSYLPPSGTTPDATTSIKGVIQLAGDLGGTAGTPTVPGLAAKVSSVTAADGTIAVAGTSTAPTVTVGTIADANIAAGAAIARTKLDSSTQSSLGLADSAVQGARQITAGTGLSGGGDLTANRSLSVTNDTTTQRLEIASGGTLQGTRKRLNFITGAGMSITAADDSTNNKVDVTLSSSSGANGIDARQYGGSWDGVGDDAAAINAAIAAAAAGQKILLPNSVAVGSTITVSTPGVEFVGLTRGATKITRLADVTVFAFTGQTNNMLYRTGLRHLRVDGNGTLHSTWTSPLVTATNAYFFDMEEVFFQNSNGIGMVATNVWDSYWTNVHWMNAGGSDGTKPQLLIQNAGDGNSLHVSNNIWIVNGHWENFSDGAIWITGIASPAQHVILCRFVNAKVEVHGNVRGNAIKISSVSYIDFVNAHIAVSGGLAAGVSQGIDMATIGGDNTHVRISGMAYSFGSFSAGDVRSLFRLDGSANANTHITLEDITFGSGSGSKPASIVSFAGTNNLYHQRNMVWNLNWWNAPTWSGSPTSVVGGSPLAIYGTITDAVFDTDPVNGDMAIEQTTRRLAYRTGGVWQTVPVTDIKGLYDDFSTDTVTAGLWTFPIGSAANVQVANGVLSTLVTSEVRMTRSLTLPFADISVVIKITFGATPGGQFGPTLRHVNGTFSTQDIWFNIGASSATISGRTPGPGNVSLKSVNYTTFSANQTIWAKLSAVGNMVVGEIFTTDPALGGSAYATATGMLPVSLIPAIGAGKFGTAGIRMQAGASQLDTTISDLRIYPAAPGNIQDRTTTGHVRNAVTADYTVTTSDGIVAVTDTTATRTITLPAANAVLPGQTFVVKDESGAANTNNITVSRAGSDTIDGATTTVISTAYGKVTLYSDATSKWFTL